MSLISQPMRLKFDGSPLTGIVPPKVVLHTGQMTLERMDYVRRAYRLFCFAKDVSVTDYFVTNRKMTDGTRIRITSFMGDDLVQVWASGGETSQMLPHGFVVAVGDLKPLLYNKKTGKDGEKWFVGGTAPQIRKNSSMYSQILRVSGGKEPKNMVLPIVYSYVEGPTWDYWRHAGPVGDSSLKMPFAIDRNKGGDEPLSFHDLHFATSREATNMEGEVLYTHIPADSAVRGDGGGDGDPPQPLAPSTDGAGKRLLLSSLRSGILAASVELYILSPRTEVLKCTGLGKYAKYSLEKNIGEILLMKPIKNTVRVSLSRGANDLGEDASGNLSFKQLGGPGLSRVTGTMWSISVLKEAPASVVRTSGLDGAAWYGFTTLDIPVTPITTHRAFTQEFRSEVFEERSELIGLSGADDAFTMEYVARLDYPDETYFRGGISNYTYDGSLVPREEYFAKNNYRIRRADSRRSTIGKPEVFLTSWDGDNLKIFFGEVNSKMTGHSYWDRYSATFAGVFLHPDSPDPISTIKYAPDATPEGSPPVGGWPVGTTFTFNVAGYAQVMATDQRPMLRGLQSQHTEDALASESYDPIKQTLDYTLTARHVLDYDHRGEFWAAIEVEVKCTGYLAKNPETSREARDEHRCYVVDDPTYTITFSFVASWGNPGGGNSGGGGDSAKKVLKTFSGMKKPLFEAPISYMVDPYDWPPGVPETLVEYANMKHIAPPASVMSMVENIAKHQGMNTNFVGVNRYENDSADFISEKGIEHSYIKNGREVPHDRRSAGMLYARDISTQDLMHVEWLLHATTCDAPRYNNWLVPDPIHWYYMPQVGEFLGSDEKWHIEMRDGAIVDWSNDIPKAPKDKFEREIALYQT